MRQVRRSSIKSWCYYYQVRYYHVIIIFYESLTKIYSELYLDPTRKTIQPITKQVGGIAGN